MRTERLAMHSFKSESDGEFGREKLEQASHEVPGVHRHGGVRALTEDTSNKGLAEEGFKLVCSLARTDGIGGKDMPSWVGELAGLHA